MTQSPQSGQTAPRSTDFGSVTTSRHSGTTGDNGAPAGEPARESAVPSSPSAAQNPAYGAPVHADAPTGSMPYVSGTAFQPGGVGSSAAARPSTATSSSGQSQPRAGRTVRPRGPRRARLQLRHINPWTVLKFSCVLSIALFFVWLIVVGVLFGVLDAAGIIDKINNTVIQLNGPGSNAPVTASVVFGGAAIVGVVNIVLFIALSTVGSVVYNLCADLVGGIEITLSER